MTRIPDQVYRRLPKRLPDELRFSNYCLGLDGVNNTINCGSAASLDDVNDFTWEFWMYWRSLPVLPNTGSYVMSKGWQKFLMLYYLQGYYAYVDCATTDATRNTANGVIPLNKWIMVDMTYDGGATKTIHIYQNAVEVLGGGTTPGAGAEVSDAASNLVFGFLAQDYFDGLLNEARIIPQVLTQSQMLESLYRGYARRELDARLVLRMEEGSGLTAYDESGYGNNGSLLPAATPPVWTPVRKYELLAEAGV